MSSYTGGSGGKRKLVDEKQIVKEVCSLLQLSKAVHREQKQQAKKSVNAKSSGAAPMKPTPAVVPPKAKPTKSTQKAKPGAGTAKAKAARKSRPGNRKKQRRAARRKMNAKRKLGTAPTGTVWITVSGALRSADFGAAQLQHNAEFRGVCNEKLRLQRLLDAEAYVESAWRQAAEAGYLDQEQLPAKGRELRNLGSSAISDEGRAYLQEQYGIAKEMIMRARANRIGSWTAQLLTTGMKPSSSPGKHGEVALISHNSAAAEQAIAVPPAKPPARRSEKAFPLAREIMADLLVREDTILNRDFGVSSGSATAAVSAEKDPSNGDVLTRAEFEQRSMYFTLSAPSTPSVAAGAATTPLPLRCIVRVRNSSNRKATAILSNAKQVNYFKSNCFQHIRKELNL